MKNENGFTLTELIVAIVIIGILAIVVTAHLNNLFVEANTAACKANQSILNSAQRLHYTENCIAGDCQFATEIDELIPLISTGNIPVCPAGGEYFIDSEGFVLCTEPDHEIVLNE